MNTLDELLINTIVGDVELKKKLVARIGGVLDKVDFEHILVDSVENAITDIFEQDAIYNMLEDTLKSEIRQAISAYFSKK